METFKTMLKDFIGNQPAEIQAEKPAQITEPERVAEKIPSIMDSISGDTSNAGPQTDEIGGFDSVLDYLEGGLNQAANDAEKQPKTQAPQAPDVEINGNNDAFMSQGVEISVEIYVEILEAVCSALASWWAQDEQTNFAFEKRLKERYIKVTELYAKTQNVKVSPGFLFGAFTLVIVGQMGWKAQKKRTEVLKARQFRAQIIARQSAPNSAGQMSLFGKPLENAPQRDVVVDGNKIYIPESERLRGFFEIDAMGLYKRDARGNYIKKEERLEKPSPQIRAFIDDYYNAHLVFPTNKHVKQFIKTI